MGEKREIIMIKMVKTIVKKRGLTMLGMLIGLSLVDIFRKEGFEWSILAIRIVVIIVLYFICGAIEYKSGKLD